MKLSHSNTVWLGFIYQAYAKYSTGGVNMGGSILAVYITCMFANGWRQASGHGPWRQSEAPDALSTCISPCVADQTML